MMDDLSDFYPNEANANANANAAEVGETDNRRQQQQHHWQQQQQQQQQEIHDATHHHIAILRDNFAAVAAEHRLEQQPEEHQRQEEPHQQSQNQGQGQSVGGSRSDIIGAFTWNDRITPPPPGNANNNINSNRSTAVADSSDLFSDIDNFHHTTSNQMRGMTMRQQYEAMANVIVAQQSSRLQQQQQQQQPQQPQQPQQQEQQRLHQDFYQPPQWQDEAAACTTTQAYSSSSSGIMIEPLPYNPQDQDQGVRMQDDGHYPGQMGSVGAVASMQPPAQSLAMQPPPPPPSPSSLQRQLRRVEYQLDQLSRLRYLHETGMLGQPLGQPPPRQQQQQSTSMLSTDHAGRNAAVMSQERPQTPQDQDQGQASPKTPQDHDLGQACSDSRNSKRNGEDVASPLTPPGLNDLLPVRPSKSSTAASSSSSASMRSSTSAVASEAMPHNRRVRQYEEAARTMLLSRSQCSSRQNLATDDKSGEDGPLHGSKSPVAATDTIFDNADDNGDADIATPAARTASGASDDATAAIRRGVNNRKRKAETAEPSWRDGMRDDAEVMACRERTRRKISHYVGSCMLNETTSAVTNAQFRRVLASKLESKLFDAAPTFEQYSDATSLEARLKIVAMQIGKRIESKGSCERSNKRQRIDNNAASTASGGGSAEDHAKARREALRGLVGDEKYDEINRLVDEIRTIRRTSDVWMCSESANRRPGTLCGSKPRGLFTKASLEAASVIVARNEEGEESKENSQTDTKKDSRSTSATKTINLARPSSPEELMAVDSMPRALSEIYFGTRLVDAVVALGSAHGGSSPQLESRVYSVEWDRLLFEARRNLQAFRVLEKSSLGGGDGTGRTAKFVEVCSLSGGCRQESASKETP